MIDFFDFFARPLLMRLDPEDAHRATILALKAAPRMGARADDPCLSQKCFGLTFPNPIGMAAGFDKNAEAVDGVLSLGFGFAEIGTVTPKPQPGNPRPRLFRSPADRAIVNRFGFNNQGHAAAARRLAARRARAGIVGVNLGANKESRDRIADYVAGVSAFAPLASYFTINVSSPNTPGLRDLQNSAALDELLARVREARDNSQQPRPLLLKIAPDVALADLDDIVRIARARGIDGMIVSNTTISRPLNLVGDQGKEAGGLSGRPLFDLSTQMLRETYIRAEAAFPLIGVGGVDGARRAIEKFEAGASLIQLYSGLVYEGAGLVGKIKQGLLARLKQDGLNHISQLTGRGATPLSSFGAVLKKGLAAR